MARGSRVLTSCAAAAALLGAAAVLLAAPLRVDNPAQAPASRTVTLTEAWRTGGDDEEVLLGQIGSAAVDAEGRIHVLDTQLAQVVVFSPDGAYLRTLGREGDGPGEMRRPVALDVHPDGTVSVVQPFPGKIINLKADGTPAGDISLGGADPTQGGLGVIVGARERAGHLVVAAMRNNFGGATGDITEVRYLASLDPRGAELRRHAEMTTKRNVEKMVFDEKAEFFAGDRGRWDLGPDGRLYLTPRFDAYEIEVRSPAGTPELIIARPYTPRQRTRDEIAEMRGGRRMNINGREPQIVETFAETDPAIASITVLDDGSLWVVGSHGRDRWRDQGEVRYDVYTSQGKLREEVTVKVPAGGEGNRLILLGNGRFLLVRGQETLSIQIQAGSGGGQSRSTAPNADDTVPLELVVYDRP